MSADLTDLAAKIVGWADEGEQVEAYAARGTSTTIRTYEGEVESLTSGSTAGIGVRVIVEGRQGFASAGLLDDDVLAETLDEARANAEFAEVDESVQLAVDDGVAQSFAHEPLI